MRSHKAIINYVFAAFIAQGSYFILIPIIINFLGEEALADIELFNVYANLLFQVFGLNICSAVTKYKYESKDNIDYLEFSSNIYAFGILMSLFSCLFSFLIIFFQPSYWKLSTSLTALLPLAVFFLFSNFWIQNYFVTLKKVIKYRNYQILIGFVKIFSIVLIVFLLDRLDSFSKILSEFLILALLSIFFVCSEKIQIKVYRFKSDIKRALKFSSPLVLYVIVNNLLNYSDQLFISNYFEKIDLAIYSLGYRVGMIILIFYVSIANYYSINFYENFENQNKNKNNTINIIALLFVASITLIFLSSYYIEYSSQWSGYKLNLALKINKLIFFSYFINSIFLLYSRELFYEGKTFRISLLVIICAFLNIVLNFFFLKSSGIIMAAYTTLISYALLALLSIILMLKSNRKINSQIIIVFILFVFLFYLIIF